MEEIEKEYQAIAATGLKENILKKLSYVSFNISVKLFSPNPFEYFSLISAFNISSEAVELA